MRLTLSNETAAAIVTGLYVAICATECEVKRWAKEDRELPDELSRQCLGSARKQLRELTEALDAFRAALGGGRG